MNIDTIQGKWKQLMGDAKVQWAKLTDDDLARVDGQTDKLVGLIQERYGRTRDQAQKEVDRFFDAH